MQSEQTIREALGYLGTVFSISEASNTKIPQNTSMVLSAYISVLFWVLDHECGHNFREHLEFIKSTIDTPTQS